MPSIGLAGDMPRPDKAELARTMIAFTLGIPVAYFVVRTILAIAGIG